MKRLLLILTIGMALLGCQSIPLTNYSPWARGKEEMIRFRLNNEIAEILSRVKKYQSWQEGKKPVLIESVHVTPTGDKIRLTDKEGKATIFKQDEFTGSYVHSWWLRTPEKDADGGIIVGVGRVSITIQEKDF